MKREFLKELGLEDEAIDKIMAENDREIGSGKASEDELAALKAQLAEKDAAIVKTRRDAAIQAALTSAKAKNAKAAMALLDTDKLELDEDGTLKGLKEAVEALQKSDGYLFGDGGTPGDGGFNPIGGAGAGAPVTLNQAVAMHYGRI